MLRREVFFLVGVLVLPIAGCNTKPPEPVLPPEPLVHQVADLTITLRYLNQDAVIERHGRNNSRSYSNPYYKYPALLTKKRFLVFEMQAVTSESTVEFELENIDLSIGRVTGNAKSRQYLELIWNHYPIADVSQMARTMRKTLLPRVFTVSPGNAVTGYLVFAENYPETGGEGSITMYVETPGGDVGTVDIPILFSADGTEKVSVGNSGIFSD